MFSINTECFFLKFMILFFFIFATSTRTPKFKRVNTYEKLPPAPCGLEDLEAAHRHYNDLNTGIYQPILSDWNEIQNFLKNGYCSQQKDRNYAIWNEIKDLSFEELKEKHFYINQKNLDSLQKCIQNIRIAYLQLAYEKIEITAHQKQNDLYKRFSDSQIEDCLNTFFSSCIQKEQINVISATVKLVLERFPGSLIDTSVKWDIYRLIRDFKREFVLSEDVVFNTLEIESYMNRFSIESNQIKSVKEIVRLYKSLQEEQFKSLVLTAKIQREDYQSISKNTRITGKYESKFIEEAWGMIREYLQTDFSTFNDDYAYLYAAQTCGKAERDVCYYNQLVETVQPEDIERFFNNMNVFKKHVREVYENEVTAESLLLHEINNLRRNQNHLKSAVEIFHKLSEENKHVLQGLLEHVKKLGSIKEKEYKKIVQSLLRSVLDKEYLKNFDAIFEIVFFYLQK